LSPGRAFDIRVHGNDEKLYIRDVTAGNLARVTLDNSGNVGIGTTGPSEKLDVHGGHIRVFDPASNTGFVGSGRDTRITFGNDGSGQNSAWITTGGESRFIVKQNGNVGIGTTEPEGILEVAGDLSVAGDAGIIVHNISTVNNNADAIRIVDDATGQIRYRNTVGHQFGVDPSGNPSYYFTNDGSNSYLNANGGNVGIGTTEPQHKLDVEGYVQAHGYYTGDIVFQKDGSNRWRMFEDEKGLYLENLSTGEVYRFVLEKVEK
jgi:hypothetical protein